MAWTAPTTQEEYQNAWNSYQTPDWNNVNAQQQKYNLAQGGVGQWQGDAWGGAMSATDLAKQLGLGHMEMQNQGDSWGEGFVSDSPYIRQIQTMSSDNGPGTEWYFDQAGYLNSLNPMAGLDSEQQSRYADPNTGQYLGTTGGNGGVNTFDPNFVRYMDIMHGPTWNDQMGNYRNTRPPGTENVNVGGSVYGNMYYPAYGIGTGLMNQFKDDQNVQDYLGNWMGNVESAASGMELDRRNSKINPLQMFNPEHVFNFDKQWDMMTSLPTFKSWDEGANIGDAPLGPLAVGAEEGNFLGPIRQMSTAISSMFIPGAGVASGTMMGAAGGVMGAAGTMASTDPKAGILSSMAGPATAGASQGLQAMGANPTLAGILAKAGTSAAGQAWTGNDINWGSIAQGAGQSLLGAGIGQLGGGMGTDASWGVNPQTGGSMAGDYMSDYDTMGDASMGAYVDPGVSYSGQDLSQPDFSGGYYGGDTTMQGNNVYMSGSGAQVPSGIDGLAGGGSLDLNSLLRMGSAALPLISRLLGGGGGGTAGGGLMPTGTGGVGGQSPISGQQVGGNQGSLFGLISGIQGYNVADRASEKMQQMMAGAQDPYGPYRGQAANWFNTLMNDPMNNPFIKALNEQTMNELNARDAGLAQMYNDPNRQIQKMGVLAEKFPGLANVGLQASGAATSPSAYGAVQSDMMKSWWPMEMAKAGAIGGSMSQIPGAVQGGVQTVQTIADIMRLLGDQGTMGA